MPPGRLSPETPVPRIRSVLSRPGGALFALLVLAGLALATWSAVQTLRMYSGDAAIYWAYAKSFWEHGPFSYGPGGPRHAATSPLWAFVLIGMHPFFGSSFVAYKIAGLVTVAACGVSTYRLADLVTADRRVAIVAGLLVFACPELQQPAGTGYETGLFALVLLESVRRTLRVGPRKEGENAASALPWGWIATLGMLPLARPEGALFLAPLLAWGLVRLHRGGMRIPRLALLAALVGLPSLAYYGGMGIATGEIVPAPVQARYLRRVLNESTLGIATARAIVDQCIGAMYLDGWYFRHFHRTWEALVALGAAILVYRRSREALLVAAPPVLLAVAFFTANPGELITRYGAPVVPFGVIVATVGAAAIVRFVVRQGARAGAPGAHAAALVVSAGILLFLNLPAQLVVDKARISRIPARAVLDRPGSRRLEQRLGPDAVVLTYEVQIQYDLACKVMSADGVVGGEIIPYLYEKNVRRFLIDHGVTHVLTSEAFADRSIFEGTILPVLAGLPDDTPGMTVDDLRFVRVTERRIPRSSDPRRVSYLTLMPHWLDAYEVRSTSASEP